jgi:low affinity Fe/Cu permease
MSFSKHFSKLSHLIADSSGRPGATILACTFVFVWLITGPLFEFSNTWQLVINTGKLDELIRAHEGAHNALLDLEELTQEELGLIKQRYESLAQKARKDLKSGKLDTERVEV